jgi:hypothetical protein
MICQHKVRGANQAVAKAADSHVQAAGHIAANGQVRRRPPARQASKPTRAVRLPLQAQAADQVTRNRSAIVSPLFCSPVGRKCSRS